jgi:hypothetical protein
VASSQTPPAGGQRRTREQSVRGFFRVGFLALDELYDPAISVAEAARRAYTPTGPSLPELERRIAARRAEADQTAVAS